MVSVGLSKYYEYVMLRIDEEWDSGNNFISEDERRPRLKMELYNELLKRTQNRF